MRFFLLLALLFRLSQPKLLKPNSNGSIDRMRHDSIGSGQESSEDWDTKESSSKSRSIDRLRQDPIGSGQEGIEDLDTKDFSAPTDSSNSDLDLVSRNSADLKLRNHKMSFQSIGQSDSDSTGLNHSNHKISPANPFPFASRSSNGSSLPSLPTPSRSFRTRRDASGDLEEAKNNVTENEQLITKLTSELAEEKLELGKLVTDLDKKKKAYDDAMEKYDQKTAERTRLTVASRAAVAAVNKANSELNYAKDKVRQLQDDRNLNKKVVDGKESEYRKAQNLVDSAQEELSNGKSRIEQLNASLPGLYDAILQASTDKLFAEGDLKDSKETGACKKSKSSPECEEKEKALTEAARVYAEKQAAYTTASVTVRNVTSTWPDIIETLNTKAMDRRDDHQLALQHFTQRKYDQKIAAAVAAEQTATKSLEDANKLKEEADDQLSNLKIDVSAEVRAASSAKTAWETAKTAKEEKEKHTKGLQEKLTAAENARSELKEKVEQAKKDATKKSESSVGLIIGIVLAVIIVIILLLGCVCYRMKKRRSADDGGPSKRRSKSRSKSKDFKIKSSSPKTTTNSTEKISGSASDCNLKTEGKTKPAVAAAPVMKLERDNSKPYDRDYSNCVKRFPNHVYKTPKGTLAPYPPNASPWNTTPASELISKGRIDCKVIYARDHKYVSSTPSSSVAQITYNFSKEYRFHIVPPFARKENNKVSKQILKAEKMVKGNYECDELIREITAEEYASSDNLRYNFDFLDVELVLKCMLEFYKEGKALARMTSPLVIIGDTHGQLACLIAMFSMFTEANKPGFLNPKFLFLGDYVDRVNKSLGLIMLLFMFKLKFGDNFVLLRGNHETSGVNANYGFRHELTDRFGKEEKASKEEAKEAPYIVV